MMYGKKAVSRYVTILCPSGSRDDMILTGSACGLHKNKTGTRKRVFLQSLNLFCRIDIQGIKLYMSQKHQEKDYNDYSGSSFGGALIKAGHASEKYVFECQKYQIKHFACIFS